MLLKEDKHEFKVDIYEASDRIGGRLYTRRLDGKSAIGTPVPGGEYDYFVS
jgi:monoamine oxidase